jgi:RNA polymerase sigma-70 factor (ECF subfamily)
VSGVIDWREIALLYEGLVRIAPTIGAQVGRAVALAESGDVASGVAALDGISGDVTANYQPWWAARGHLLQRCGRNAEARSAFERAASLTDDPALRAYLLERGVQ